MGAALATASALTLASCWLDATEPSSAARVQVTAGSATLSALGQTTQLSVRVLDGRGRLLRGAAPSWQSEDPDVARVSADGLVTAQGPGTATIVATLAPAVGSIRISVDQVPTGLSVVQGRGQHGAVGEPLPEPVVFRMLDAGGAPIAGATLQVAVSGGGGAVDPGEATTDAEGRAPESSHTQIR